jgi:UPF0755 protein
VASGRRRAAAAAGLALALGALGAGLWLGHALWGFRTSRPSEVWVAEGAAAREILSELEAAGLVPSPRAARLYLRAASRGRSLHYGCYRFAAGARPVEILEAILDGRVAMFEVTVVEGSDAAAIGATFAARGVGSDEDWQRLQSRVEWVEEAVGNAPSLEGFLFPDTYRFAVGIAAERAARHLAERFVTVWREEAAAAGPLWGSPLEVVTLASLVEAETALETERALIAGVFVNRLRRGMALQCDPTVVYALKRRGEWQGRLLRAHWQVDDPYNTYRSRGLPPGPINSPGRAALRAACAPAATPHLYFVARPEGGHAFSTTLAEHNRAVARLRAARR